MKSTWFLILLGLCGYARKIFCQASASIWQSIFTVASPWYFHFVDHKKVGRELSQPASHLRALSKRFKSDRIFKPIQPPFSFCHALSTVSGISFYALETLQRDLKSTWWNIASETCQRELLKWTWKALVFKPGLEVLATQAMETQGFGICRNSPHSLLPNVLLFSSTYWTSYLDSAKRSCSILHWIFQKQPWFYSKAVDVHSTSPCHLAHLLNSRVPPWLNI